MIVITTISDKYFELNGTRYARIYEPLKQGAENIGLYNIYDTKNQLQSSVHFSEYEVDGSTYGTQALTVAALLDVVYSQQGSGTGGNEFSDQFQLIEGVVNLDIDYITAGDPVVPQDVLEGTFLFKFGSNGGGNGQFGLIRSAIANASNIYVSDSFTVNRIQIFDSAGGYQSTFGGDGSGDGQFLSIPRLTMDSANIFAMDQSRDDMQIFDLSGNYITKFSFPATAFAMQEICYDGTRLLCERSDDSVLIYQTNGNLDDTIQLTANSSGGITADGTYIYTQSAGVLYKHDYSGNLIASFDTGLSFPDSPLITDGFYIYVGDNSGHRIMVYDTDFYFIKTWGSEGSGDGQFRTVMSVYLANDKLYVGENLNYRVQVFN